MTVTATLLSFSRIYEPRTCAGVDSEPHHDSRKDHNRVLSDAIIQCPTRTLDAVDMAPRMIVNGG